MPFNIHLQKKAVGHLVIVVVSTLALLLTLLITGVAVFERHINLNDGKVVVSEQNTAFAPGMTLERAFFIEAYGEHEVRYRLYIDRVEGPLQEYLEVTLLCEGEQIYKGAMRDFVRDRVGLNKDVLKKGDRKNYTIRFHLPAEVDNDAVQKQVTFVLKIEAVEVDSPVNVTE